MRYDEASIRLRSGINSGPAITVGEIVLAVYPPLT